MPSCQYCPKEFNTDGGLHIHQASIHKLYVHGTIGGYRRHRKRKEKPCDKCQQAKRDYENYKGDNVLYAKMYMRALRLLRDRYKKEFKEILAELRAIDHKSD